MVERRLTQGGSSHKRERGNKGGESEKKKTKTRGEGQVGGFLESDGGRQREEEREAS